MFSPNKNNSPLTSSFEQPVYQNQKQIKNIQTKYFTDEYQKSINQKIQKQEQQKLKKKQEYELYNRKNEQYLNSVALNRLNKFQEKQYMAQQYEDMINYRKIKQQQQKNNEKAYQRNILGQRSWIRDTNQQRQINKMKINRYSQQLQMHVKAQEQRVKQEIQLEKQMRNKINQQAQIILQKQMQQLKQRQRKKDLFQQRQNQLLGSQNLNHDNSLSSSVGNSRVIQQINMRKRQQELYGKGLEIQRITQQQRKKKEIEQGYTPGQSYNPITNPLPVVYKNPNVLRMLSQK